MKQNAQELLGNDQLIKTKDMSSSDIMISKCEEKKYDYIVLFQDPLNGLNPLSRTFCGTNGSK